MRKVPDPTVAVWADWPPPGEPVLLRGRRSRICATGPPSCQQAGAGRRWSRTSRGWWARLSRIGCCRSTAEGRAHTRTSPPSAVPPAAPSHPLTARLRQSPAPAAWRLRRAMFGISRGPRHCGRRSLAASMIVTPDATSISMPMRDSPDGTRLRLALPRPPRARRHHAAGRGGRARRTERLRRRLAPGALPHERAGRGDYSNRQVVAVTTTHTRPPAARPPAASDTSTASSCSSLYSDDKTPGCDSGLRSLSRPIGLSATSGSGHAEPGPESTSAAGWNLGRENRITFAGRVHSV